MAESGASAQGGGEMTADDIVVAAEDLTVRYGRTTACEHVSFEIPRGSVYALLGRNGAGKSSLVRCLLGHQKPWSGAAFLFGENVWKNRSRAMHRVGVVPEEPDAPPEMTARQIGAFCSRLYPFWSHPSFDARLERFGIPPDLAFRNLSKGQRGMLLFALALAPKPELLVLDDPTLGLDVVARKSTYEDLVGDLADRSPTVMITSHDLTGIEGIADQIGILKEGRLVLTASLEELKARYRKLRYQMQNGASEDERFAELEHFKATHIRRGSPGIEAVISDYEVSKFDRFHSTGGVCNAEASPMSLEEIVIAIVGEEMGDAL